jgi:septal ring factor EnvC (AmiA/AmiB activator)
MPMNSVAAAAAEELMKENEELQAKIKAMEEENAKAKEEADADAKAKEDEAADEKDAKAKAKGAKPVATGSGESPTATKRWNEAIDAERKNGVPMDRAVRAANKKNPGLRQQYLDEVNVKQSA